MTDANKTCVAIVALAMVEIVALLTGHNGTMLRLVYIGIAGLGGFSLNELLRQRKPK